MLVPSYLFLFMSLSLQVSLCKASPMVKRHAAPIQPPFPTIYSPVILNQLCQDNANYCIYVDQNTPGTVKASPVNASDAQGAFLFERSPYRQQPFYVCYGGCCVNLDFAVKPGCVTMNYIVRGEGDEKGHLLARFANDIYNIVGPRDDMPRTLEACPEHRGSSLPYAVIVARPAHDRRKPADPGSAREPQNQAYTWLSQSTSLQSSSNPNADSKPVHDYFDDVTVPLADA